MLEVGSTGRGIERVINSAQATPQNDLVGSVVAVGYLNYLGSPDSSITPSVEVTLAIMVLCW